MPQPLQITEVIQLKPKIWRITAVCEVTPFREWMIGEFAIDVPLKAGRSKLSLSFSKSAALPHGDGRNVAALLRSVSLDSDPPH